MRPRELRVEDLMTTAVIALKASETVTHLREEMDTAQIRHIPVVDDRNHVIGIVSNRDLERARQKGNRARIAEIMTTKVLTIRGDKRAAEAASIMIDHKIGSLPVVNDEGEIVGIITETDFLAVAQRMLNGFEVGPRA